MPSTKAIALEDGTKLALSSDNLGSPSPGTKKPFSYSSKSSCDESGCDFLPQFFPDFAKYLVPCSMVDPKLLSTYIPVGGDESQLLTPGPTCLKYIGPPVPCSECSKEHKPCSYCPYVPVTCNVCYKLHRPTNCPYLHQISQGADFDRDKYEVVCQCGNLFNVDKWICTFCTGRSARLEGKHCAICFRSGHGSYECPKDEVAAAEYKSLRDHKLSVDRKMIPYEEVVAQRAAAIGESFQRDS